MKLWNKMRERGSWWMALLFIVIGLILNQINSNLGFEFTSATLLALLVFLLLAILVSFFIRLVDIKAEKQVKDYLSLVSWVFLIEVVLSLITPLATWIVNMIQMVL